VLADTLRGGWLDGEALDRAAATYAIEHLVPAHLARVRERREALIDKTLAAVHARLTKEINYWDGQAATYRHRLSESRGPQKLGWREQAKRAQERADGLVARLEARTGELARARRISAAPPVVVGGALVAPVGLLLGARTPRELVDTRVTEAIAMQAVLRAEAALGHYPKDVSAHNLGYDIESLNPADGRLRFIEVKGRKAGAQDVKVTKNEILTALNCADQFILALVEVTDGVGGEPRYVRNPFQSEPDSRSTGVDYSLRDLLALATEPS